MLDLGCGWGPLLDFIRGAAPSGVGRDALLGAGRGVPAPRPRRPPPGRARRSTARRFGAFDAVASLGAFEHFCSPEDYRAGRQEEIYRDLFAQRRRACCPTGGRFYLQTMVFGRNMIPLDEVDIDAPRDSDAWYLALMGRQFPGSWLPFGQEQVVRCAEPHFRLVSSVERPARLHRDDPPVARALRRAEPAQDAAQAAARARAG